MACSYERGNVPFVCVLTDWTGKDLTTNNAVLEVRDSCNVWKSETVTHTTSEKEPVERNMHGHSITIYMWNEIKENIWMSRVRQRVSSRVRAASVLVQARCDRWQHPSGVLANPRRYSRHTVWRHRWRQNNSPAIRRFDYTFCLIVPLFKR